GFESWENVWGYWVGMTPRDSESLRRTATIERAYPSLLTSADWEPATPTLQEGIFASKFPGEHETLWTLVNRADYDVSGPQLRAPHEEGRRYFDLYHGVELAPHLTTNAGVAGADLIFDMEKRGFGAVLAMDKNVSDDALQSLLKKMKHLSKKPLTDYSSEW